MSEQIATISGTGRSEEICIALRRAILDQVLKPGAKLPEDTLGERFGVSRTIARIALVQLAAEGLVDLRRNRGATVARPSWEDAHDLFDLRVRVEEAVVGRLAGQLTPKQVETLRAHVRKESKVRDESEAVSIRLATEFHILLAEMTNSPVLIRYVRELCLRCGLTLTLHARPHSSECAINEHLDIIDALTRNDARRACELMSGHLQSVADRALIEANRPESADLMDILAPYSGQNDPGGV